MVEIQFIESNKGYVDVQEGTNVLINLGVADVRDFTTRKGAYSQTILLTGSKRNAVRMNRYFDVNIVAGTFDVNKRQKVNLIQNGVIINSVDMFLQLKKLNVKNCNLLSYEVEVKDAVADLFTVINNRELTDLNFGDVNHQLTAANVIASFNHTAADVYKYHLTTNDDNEYQLSQFKPAIFALPIWDRIIRGAGFDWEWQDMDDGETQFSNHLVPSSSNDNIEGGGEQVIADVNSFDKEISENGVAVTTGETPRSQFIVGNEIEDLFNLYNPLTGVYTSNLNYPAGSSLLFEFKAQIQLVAQNNYNGSVESFNFAVNSASLPVTAEMKFLPNFLVEKNGSTISGVKELDIDAVIVDGVVLSPFQTKVIKTADITFNVPVSDILQGDQFRTLISSNNELSEGNGVLSWYDVGNVLTSPTRDVDVKFVVSDLEMRIKTNSNSGYYFGQTVDVNKFIPRKAKQSDFVKDIMTMHNLWVEVDESNPNKLLFVKRNKYLDAGKVKDWSKEAKKLATDRQHEIKFLSDISKKKTVLTYKEDKDDLNVAYKGVTNEVYGQVEYTYDSEFVRDTDKKELKFSPTPLHSTSFGAIVPAINGVEPKMNIRILLDGGVKPCSPFIIKDAPDQSVTVSNGYPYVGHFDDPITPTLDLNFAVCDYYFYSELLTPTNNGLFNINWRRYMNAVNKGRLFTGLFWLDEYDIRTFKPNDKVWVEGAYWHVNKIIAYNANKRQLTKVELFPVDKEAKIPYVERPFQNTKPFRPTGGGERPVRPIGGGFGSPITAPVQEWIKETVKSLNSNLGNGGVEIVGKNNVIIGNVKTALVVGNGLTASRDGVTTQAVNLAEGVYLTAEGMIGAPHNLISAGRNEVLNEFSTSAINLITGGINAVRGIGSYSSVNKLKG